MKPSSKAATRTSKWGSISRAGSIKLGKFMELLSISAKSKISAVYFLDNASMEFLLKMEYTLKSPSIITKLIRKIIRLTICTIGKSLRKACSEDALLKN